MATVTKTQLRTLANAKGFELVRTMEAYSRGQRKVWAIKKGSVVLAIGNGQEALEVLQAL